MKMPERSVLERRIVFLLLVLAVALPIIFPLGLKTQSTPLTGQVFALVDSMPAGVPVIVSFDYDPSTITELQPMAEAVIEHAWKKGTQGDRHSNVAAGAPGGGNGFRDGPNQNGRG